MLIPEAYHHLTGKERKGSGGWLEASSKELASTGGIFLYVASASPLVKELVSFQCSEINYAVFPLKQIDSAKPYETFMRQLSEEIKPDVVHIHGTEYPFGLAYINAVGSEQVVISMQGVMSGIAEHYTDGLTRFQIIKNITLRDLRLKTILGEEREYKKRGQLEQETIRKARYVMGRTSFDQKYVKSINPPCGYFSCNESLRDSFYHAKWIYNSCTPHTIFLSQSNYPVKGLHQFLKAIPLIKEKYPDVKVRIAGEDITRHKTKTDIIKYSGYGSIIYHLIKRLGLKDCVTFTGLLGEKEMAQEYLNASLFVCPSTCENSSNSIAEAQILGVPCLASNRGGNPDMIPNHQCGQLYEFDDTQALAECVCRVFDTASSYDNSAVCEMARKRHNRGANLERTLSIYNVISKNNEI